MAPIIAAPGELPAAAFDGRQAAIGSGRRQIQRGQQTGLSGREAHLRSRTTGGDARASDGLGAVQPYVRPEVQCRCSPCGHVER